jgi:hypothetical protein
MEKKDFQNVVKEDGVKEDEVKEKIKKIMIHTNYTEEEAKEKLNEFDDDYLKVIRNYLNLPEKSTSSTSTSTSLNQAIFRKLRYKLDESMREYRESIK